MQLPQRAAADRTAAGLPGDQGRSAPRLVAAPAGRRGPGAQPAPAGRWNWALSRLASTRSSAAALPSRPPGRSDPSSSRSAVEPAWRTAPVAGQLALGDGAVACAGGNGREWWWWLPWRTGEETPPSTPLSHGVKVTAQVLALALTLWRGQPTASGGCWPRGGPSGKCSPALWTTATPVLPCRCAPPPPA